jgi:hypothetical protein
MFNITKPDFRGILMAAFAAVALFVTPAAQAVKLRQQNLTELITEAQSIVSGSVTDVHDGIAENGIPYTEITIEVGSSAKGRIAANSTYTFRQFGLLKPRVMPNGKTLLSTAPEGFPQWRAGQTVVAFLYTPAQLTGLQTTAGLSQGLLTIENGRLMNELGNVGLFDGVEINDQLLSSEERDMLKSHGPVNPGTFMGLVGRAINGRWIENGEMR